MLNFLHELKIIGENRIESMTSISKGYFEHEKEMQKMKDLVTTSIKNEDRLKA
jgi:hypothetical protein